jgi:hypothetical protein
MGNAEAMILAARAKLHAECRRQLAIMDATAEETCRAILAVRPQDVTPEWFADFVQAPADDMRELHRNAIRCVLHILDSIDPPGPADVRIPLDD